MTPQTPSLEAVLTRTAPFANPTTSAPISARMAPSAVVVRTIGGGEVAFLTGHAPFLGALDEGEARIHGYDDSVQSIHVSGGFVEVSHDKVTILSDEAEVVGA